MTRLIIEYDARNTTAKKIIDFILSFDYFRVKEEKTSYNEEFVKKTQQSRKEHKEEKYKVIATKDLWK